jgi:F-type H+-transporting ATPase subunit delta
LAAKTLQAKRYARAIFEIASQNNELAKWQLDLQKLAQLARQTDFVSVMENPKYALATKSKLLHSQALDVRPLAVSVATLLTERGIFGLLDDVSSEYKQLVDNLRGIEKAEVITAVALDEEQKTRLMEQLESISGKKIELTLKIEPAILGGMVARVGGKLIDGSTSSQLASLKNDLSNAGL